MIADVQARFRARFVEVARQRLDRAAQHLDSDDPYWWDKIRSELHALKGEASMIGFEGVVQATRAAEDASRAGGSDDGMASRRALLREALATGRAAVDALAQPPAG